MKLVTWNLAYSSFAPYRAVSNRKKQWKYLLSLEPDVICVQEGHPSDLAEMGAAGYEVIGEPHGRRACSLLVIRTALRPEAVQMTGQGAGLLRYVVAARVTTASGSLLVASVHALAGVPAPPLKDDQNLALRRPGQLWADCADVAFAALAEMPKETGFIFAGDWNIARLMDGPAPHSTERIGSGTAFFSRSVRFGWEESMRVRYPAEVRTWLPPTHKPYQDDHIFTDAETHKRLVSTEVVYEIHGQDAFVFSDHAPVVAAFASDVPIEAAPLLSA